MKNSLKIAFCGVIAALTAALMAASLIPNARFAVPAVAGLFMIAVFATLGAPAAAACYLVAATLSFFTADKTSFVLYALFFGYYPILKPFIEKIKNAALKWAVKVIIFNFAAALCCLIARLIIGNLPGGWMLAAVWALGNIAFILYDIAVSRVAAFYYLKIHKTISARLK